MNNGDYPLFQVMVVVDKSLYASKWTIGKPLQEPHTITGENRGTASVVHVMHHYTLPVCTLKYCSFTLIYLTGQSYKSCSYDSWNWWGRLNAKFLYCTFYICNEPKVINYWSYFDRLTSLDRCRLKYILMIRSLNYYGRNIL